ncbi:MAG: response regulator [Candidatus Riflebacteria bacterium]|nr:response regulator [Candidatus Riflebacteria bacterium]
MADKIRVAVVDDDDYILQMFERRLRSEPDIQLVGQGTNGREAIRLVNSLHPDVIFLDIRMPVLNGLEAAARITSRFPNTVVAILTSEQSLQFMQEAIEIGVRKYLDKAQLGDGRELPDIVRKLHAMRPAAGTSRPEPKGLASVWSFYGPRGTAGTTNQAVNAAVELARFGYQVCLVDMDLFQGDVCLYLKPECLQPVEQPAIKLLQNLEQLGSIEEHIVRRGLLELKPDHAVDTYQADGNPTLQLRVLPSPNTPVNLDAAAIRTLGGLLDFIISAHDFVIFDLPPGRLCERATAMSLEFSEQLFVVLNQDWPSLKATMGLFQVLSAMKYPKERLSVLKSGLVVDPKLGLDNWLRQNGVVEHRVHEVPYDEDATLLAASSGVPYSLGSPDSAVAAFSRSLVERALNRPPSTGRDPSFWTRLRRGLKQVVGS